MPCQREMALNGLRALSVLRDLSTLRFSFSSIKRLNMDTCEMKPFLLDIVLPKRLGSTLSCHCRGCKKKKNY